MRPSTMVDMARSQGVRLPPNLLHIDAASMPADGRGWFRFQRAYDSARHLVRSETAMRRLIREAAEDDAAEGSVRMEIQADPTSYAPYVGGITPALEIIIDEARAASRDTGVDIGVIVAASRMKHPLDARTLARLFGGRRQAVVEHGHAVLLEHLPGLVLVEIHLIPSVERGVVSAIILTCDRYERAISSHYQGLSRP